MLACPLQKTNYFVLQHYLRRVVLIITRTFKKVIGFGVNKKHERRVKYSSRNISLTHFIWSGLVLQIANAMCHSAEEGT
jgi:hypothetical protein